MCWVVGFDLYNLLVWCMMVEKKCENNKKVFDGMEELLKWLNEKVEYEYYYYDTEYVNRDYKHLNCKDGLR